MKIYHLSSCSTCARIIKEIKAAAPDVAAELIDIKPSIAPDALTEMVALSGSYEALFSRRAMKYKSLGLKDKQLSEDDYKNYILEEYTFLKRPVIVANDKVYIGNSKKTVASLINDLSNAE